MISRFFSGLVSAVFVLTLVSSARADVVNADIFLETLNSAEKHDLTEVESQPSSENDYISREHFENSNGKHLGFSMTAVHRGPRLGIVKPKLPSVSQNPEPTAMVLLGTGLAIIAGLARHKSRRRRDE
jgi:hypothetical protein